MQLTRVYVRYITQSIDSMATPKALHVRCENVPILTETMLQAQRKDA